MLERTPRYLVIHQGPWRMRGLGALFAVAGGGLLAFMAGGGHAREPNAWVAFVVASVFSASGAAMLLLATDRLIAFDDRARVARTAVRSLVRTTITEYPFDAIRDIALESSSGRGSTDGAFYRIVFLLADGRRVPWTAVSTGDGATQAACVSAARDFGGWTSSDSALASPVAESRTHPASPKSLRWLTAVAAIFSIMGIALMAIQREMTLFPLLFAAGPAVLVALIALAVRAGSRERQRARALAVPIVPTERVA